MAIETIDPGSTLISEASFDDERGELTVTMSKGRTYTTSNFTAQQWEEFQNSPSRGRWYRETVMRLTR